MGVEPQKGQTGTGHCRAENQQFARARDVREEQVFGKHRASGDVGKHAQRRPDHHNRHDGQAVEPVGQIHGVARSHDHQVGQSNEAQHAQGVTDLLEKRHQQARLGRQTEVEARLHPFEEQFEHAHIRVF